MKDSIWDGMVEVPPGEIARCTSEEESDKTYCEACESPTDTKMVKGVLHRVPR